MATNRDRNQTRDWDDEATWNNRNDRFEDEGGFRGRDDSDEEGYLPSDRPYEGLVGVMQGAFFGEGPNWSARWNNRNRNADAAQGEHYGRGPVGYTRRDELIHDDINDHLTEHSYIDATQIAVSVKDGEVTLEGSVPDRDQKFYAEEVASQVHGVKDVTNLLKVKQNQNDLTTNTSGKQ
jgi:hypothetical protein